MIPISDEYIDRVAPNAEAAKNGRGLVLKNKFNGLHHSSDESILFGYCAGSGKQPYLCSADFAVPENPVFRCTCPSRQFPCKHSLGLLFAKVQGQTFVEAEVPESLSAKREKAQVRVEKKKEEAEKPKKVNKSALAKKIQAQLQGIDLLEKLTLDLVRLGIGNMNIKSAQEIEDQAKQLGNAYLPGAQAALYSYTKLFSRADGKFAAELTAQQRETSYSEALDQLGRLHALVKQGRSYLQRRLEDPELAPETESSIAAWLGHAWQLRELKAAGKVQEQAELVQVAFNSHDDVARQEFVDTGIWVNLTSGQVQLTKVYRPYKAVKFIKSDDSFFHVAQVQELCIYPGDVNPRVRWEGMLERPLVAEDLRKLRSFGQSDFAALTKEVKNQLKGPLSDKQPIYLLNYQRLARCGDELVIEDAQGARLVLTDQGISEEPASCHLFPLLPKKLFSEQTLVVRFRHDLDTRKLKVKPLSIITPAGVTRLTL